MKIIIELNEANFEYDIQSLVKEFFPHEEVVIRYIEGALPAPENRPKNKPLKKETENSGRVLLSVHYDAAGKKIVLTDENQKKYEVPVSYEDRKETKNRLKKAVYEIVSALTGQTLPWGTLSGIRPTKITLGMLMDGKTRDEARQFMKEIYLTSDEKADLCMTVSSREKELLKQWDYEKGYSLYIGIPFCPSTCLYCSFPSYAIGAYRGQVKQYLNALEKEMDFVKEALKEKTLDTVYVGGGTPTALSAEELDFLLTKLDKSFPMNQIRELTVEAGRPDSITEDKLKVLKNHHVSRISINPQTMNQKTLDLIGRHHSVDDVKRSFYMARELGFSNINMDIILGLPGEQKKEVEHTLQEIEKMHPEDLTVHSLAIKRSSRLNIEWEHYRRYLMENSEDLMQMAFSYAKNMGLSPYYLYRQKNMAGNLENVGFAKPEHEGIYNVLIMEEKQTIMALGAGSACKYVTEHGKTVTRSENVKDVTNYIARIDEMMERKRKKLEEISWL